MQTSEIAELRAEIARLKYREQHCSTENQALLIGAVRFMQEVAAVVGLGLDASPADILAELKQQTCASTQVPAVDIRIPPKEHQGRKEPTYRPWTVGQLHPEQRARGCEHLFAIFSESLITPKVKMTVAENLTEADANLVVEAVNAPGYGPATKLLEETDRYLREIHAEHLDGSEPALGELLDRVTSFWVATARPYEQSSPEAKGGYGV